MEDFERTNLGDIQAKVDGGVSFIVGGHSYGRVDRMSEQERTTVAESLGRLMREAGELMDALAIVSHRQQD